MSPLHALFGADPSRFGPYSPSTRLFLNPLHASPPWCSAKPMWPIRCERKGLSETFERLEALSLIDWPAAARAKHRLLRALFEPFHLMRPAPYGKLHLDFARFRANGGELLAQHAVFETLHAAQAEAGAAIGIIGRLICAIQTVLRSRYSRRRTSARYCSTASCNGLPIDHSAWRRAAL